MIKPKTIVPTQSVCFTQLLTWITKDRKPSQTHSQLNKKGIYKPSL